MSRRKSTRGHRLPPGKFVAVPVDTLKQALGLLSASEFRVFMCLCAQSQPWANGTACLTKSVIKEFRLGSTRNVTAAVRKLREAGMILLTRKHRQHIAARYGVTHLPLNKDAMAKLGFSGTTREAVDDPGSDSDSGSAAARPQGTRYRDHMGTAEPEREGSAQPHGKRNGNYSGVLARPPGKQSKTLPSGTQINETPERVIQ